MTTGARRVRPPQPWTASLRRGSVFSDESLELAVSVRRRALEDLYAKVGVGCAGRIFASLAAVAVVIVVVIGQGLIAFDVEFDYAVAADTVFDGYDFWAGVSELWRRDAKFLAVVAGGSSGVWPLLKNALTFFTCWFGGDAGRKSRIFRLLGLGGKTAILDIAFIALLVTQNARAPRLRRVS